MFFNDYNKNAKVGKKTTYFLKNEEENALGLFVYNDIDTILNKLKDTSIKFPITVIQKYHKSLLIDGYSFKIRMYLLVQCFKGNKSSYLHKRGGIFYSKSRYDKNNLNKENVLFEYTGGERGWKGDVPNIKFDCSKIKSLGWEPKFSSEKAMAESLKSMLTEIT